MVKDLKRYKLLLVEDNEGDAALVTDFLCDQIVGPQITQAGSFQAAKKYLLQADVIFDAILLDLTLPDKTGRALILEMIQLCRDKPVIVLTGYTDFQFSVDSLSLGISDYILKEDLTSLVLYKSIIYSRERKKANAALKLSEKNYNDLFQLSPLPMWVTDAETMRFLAVNHAAVAAYGYTPEEFLAMKICDISVNGHAHFPKEVYDAPGIFRHRRKDGTVIHSELQQNDIIYQRRMASVTIAYNITERLTHINAIEQQNEKLKEIAWLQSHVVRAPLCRLMGLAMLIRDGLIEEEAVQQVLKDILMSADELDDVIRQVCFRTTDVLLQKKA